MGKGLERLQRRANQAMGFKMKHKNYIKIYGECGSGKSTIAVIISEALEKYGCSVNVDDLEFQERKDNPDKVKQAAHNLDIEIETIQIRRKEIP